MHLSFFGKSNTNKNFFFLLQGGNVTFQGTDCDIDHAMDVLKVACEEEERSNPEASIAPEPYQAALFTHPELQHVGEHMIQEVKKKFRVLCWVTKGPAVHDLHLEASLSHKMDDRHHFFCLGCCRLVETSSVMLSLSARSYFDSEN